MDLYKRKDSAVWWYDFTVRGKRSRGSTKEKSKAAATEFAVREMHKVAEGSAPALAKKAITMLALSEIFLPFVEGSKLEKKSKDYLNNGWRLLKTAKRLVKEELVPADFGGVMAMDVATEDVNALRFPGGPYNANCALKTLRRMLRWAREDKKLPVAKPTIKLDKEPGRELPFTEKLEKQIAPFCGPLLKNIIVLLRDTGMRPKRELFRMRIEYLDWDRQMIFVPDSKTGAGKRFIPMSDRVLDLLMVLCHGRKEGWVFEADSESGHIITIDKQYQAARLAAELPAKLVLYGCRHDFATQVLERTGNLPLVMKLLGQKSTKAALDYQHPELELFRAAINPPKARAAEARSN